MLQFFCLEVFSCLLRVSDLLCLLRTRLRVFLFKCVCVIILVQSHMLATNALRNLNHCACHFTNSPRLSSNNMYHGFLDLFLDIAKPQPNNCFKFCKSGHRSWYWFWTYLKFWIWFQTRLQYIFKPKIVLNMWLYFHVHHSTHRGSSIEQHWPPCCAEWIVYEMQVAQFQIHSNRRCILLLSFSARMGFFLEPYRKRWSQWNIWRRTVQRPFPVKQSFFQDPLASIIRSGKQRNL